MMMMTKMTMMTKTTIQSELKKRMCRHDETADWSGFVWHRCCQDSSSMDSS
jgi:hypothetical protein